MPLQRGERAISVTVDEDDLALLHALQIAPRAPWVRIGEVLGISAVTAARRWERLSRQGCAWISAYSLDQSGSGALVEVDCDASRAHDVAVTLSGDAHAMTVEETSGSRDLLLTVVTPAVRSLHRYLQRIQQVPGVRSVRSHVITRYLHEASRWRLDALDTGRQRALRPSPPAAPSGPVDDRDRALLVVLSENGRMPLTELAGRLEVSVSTVRRRLARLSADGRLRVRCDVARPVSGYEAATTIWLDVPPSGLLQAGRAVSALPQLRLAVAVTGPQNLIVMAWLRSADEIPEFECELARRVPQARIVDRAVTLHAEKHMGRLLDRDGFARRVVPLDLWREEWSGAGVAG